MEKAPYTPNPNNVKEFLQNVQSLGTPPKVTREYLKTIGFKSSNDFYIISVLKYLKFIDTSGVPQGGWNDFKDKAKAPKILAVSIRSAYDELFNIYPDANKRDAETIINYFASKFGASAKLSQLMEQTFRKLCELADFGATAKVDPFMKPTTPVMEKTIAVPTGAGGITVNINIQLQLPPTENAAIYDSLFSALKKHLFS